MAEYISMWKRFVDFSGSSNRRDYWMAFLFHFVISSVLLIIYYMTSQSVYLYHIYTLVSLVPYISLMVRRFRDIGKGWYYIFIMLIPIIGIFIAIYWLAQPTGRYS